MTRIVGDPAEFARDAVAGLCAAHPDLVRAVDGGVVRATATPTARSQWSSAEVPGTIRRSRGTSVRA